MTPLTVAGAAAASDIHSSPRSLLIPDGNRRRNGRKRKLASQRCEPTSRSLPTRKVVRVSPMTHSLLHNPTRSPDSCGRMAILGRPGNRRNARYQPAAQQFGARNPRDETIVQYTIRLGERYDRLETGLRVKVTEHEGITVRS